MIVDAFATCYASTLKECSGAGCQQFVGTEGLSREQQPLSDLAITFADAHTALQVMQHLMSQQQSHAELMLPAEPINGKADGATSVMLCVMPMLLFI